MENTIPLAAYRAQYPARFSLLDDDKYVLHGGGTHYKVEVVQVSPPQTLELDPTIRNLSGSSASVYVLNQCLVIWMNDENIGIEIPYTLVALHALKTVEQRPILYLQLLSCEVFRSFSQSDHFTNTVELVLYEDGQSGKLELFKDNSSIQQLYNALSTCSALHFDSDSDSDGDSEPFGQWFTADNLQHQPQLEIPAGWINSGDADDLEDFHLMEADEEEEEEAGMNVTVVSGQIAGVARRRSSGSERQKMRRVR